MKKAATLLALFLGIVLFVPGQTPEPIDLILALDTSASMSGSYREVNEYISGPFLKEFLRIGDTFHLISFSGAPRLEISRRIEGIGDVEALIGRLFLLLPLDPYTDIAGALDYTERYVVRIPSSRPKQVVFLTDGEQNPAPSAAPEDSGALEVLVDETAARLRRNGTDFHWVTFPVTGSGPSSGRRPAPSRTAPPPAAVQPRVPPEPVITSPEPPDVPSEPAASPEPPAAPPEPEAAPPEPADVPSEPPVPPPEPEAAPPEPPAAPLEFPSAPPEPAVVTSQPPIERASVSGGFNYIPLLIGVGLALILILGLLIFFKARKLNASPNRAVAYAAGRNTDIPADYAADRPNEKTAPAAAFPVIPAEKDDEKPVSKGSVWLSLVVDDQNTNIGRRNIHSLKAGDVYTIGGGKLDDYLIFLVPVPAHIGEVRFDGKQCTFVPKKPQCFPEIGSQPVPDCIGKTIRVVSDKRYEITFHLERYEDPLDSLNNLLHTAALPPKPPKREK
jgi:hypothetical protein